MGAEQSVPSSMGFEALWASLPDDVQASVTALASKESDAILKPNPKAPGPLPPVPVGVTVRLDSEMARAALLIVPRLQRNAYAGLLQVRGSHPCHSLLMQRSARKHCSQSPAQIPQQLLHFSQLLAPRRAPSAPRPRRTRHCRRRRRRACPST